jgi:chemotaxis protein CheC
MVELSESERDAISESFNIGIGVAAAALSEMVGQEVALSVPDVRILRREELAQTLVEDRGRRITGVRERFNGPLSGRAMLLFPEERSLELVRLLLRQEVELSFLTEMEEEALTEVGNIILNACLSNIANIVGSEISSDLPQPVKGHLSEIILSQCEEGSEDYLMQLHMEFSVKEVDIAGYIAFLMDINSLDVFRRKLAEYFDFSMG